MPLDDETRQYVKRFHQKLTLVIGLIFVLGSGAAAYVLLTRGGRPVFLQRLERLAGRFSR